MNVEDAFLFEPTPVTNDERARRARLAFDAYRIAALCNEESEQLSDLIGDLLHLVRKHGEDPAKAIERGVGHFLAEEADPPDGLAVTFDVTLCWSQR